MQRRKGAKGTYEELCAFALYLASRSLHGIMFP
jgi:hypothetical protein